MESLGQPAHGCILMVGGVQVSVCPGGLASGYTYFIPQEEHLEAQVVTRGYLEGRMVVGMAGRCSHFLLPPLY